MSVTSSRALLLVFVCWHGGKFTFPVKIQVWLSKLHALATGKLHNATILSNSTFFLCLHKLLLSELKGT